MFLNYWCFRNFTLIQKQDKVNYFDLKNSIPWSEKTVSFKFLTCFKSQFLFSCLRLNVFSRKRKLIHFWWFFSGIVERDISVIRKETEINSLKSEMAKLKTELSAAQKQVFTLEDSEKLLRERLADEKHRSLTLEKMASIQKQKVEIISFC